MTGKENTQQKNNREILKSTGLLGGSSLITIIVGMVRTKFIAILLGPSGIGFMGSLSSLRDIVSTVAGMGLSSSGMRQIATSNAKGDQNATAIVVKTMRILMWGTGILGMFVMAIGSALLSKVSFGTAKYALPIALLGLAVLFLSISTGQMTILQGHRRIGDVARINIIGAINGTIIGLPCYFLFGMDGVVPSLVLAALAMLGTSYWFARKLQFNPVAVDRTRMRHEAKTLLVFGVPLMLSVLIGYLTTYVIQVFLTREAGLASVGLYQAAFSLSGVLVSFVLAAMGTDYYPRLTAVAESNEKVYREVNSQTEIALLLGVPALAATVVFIPIIIRIFYSSKFDSAIPILRWAIFGVLGRIISWPLGYIMLAKARGNLYFMSELFNGIFYVLAVVICYKCFGLPGVGIAFMLSYFCYIIMLIILSYKLARVKWTFGNILLIVNSLAVMIVLTLIQLVHILLWIRYLLGAIVLVCITILYVKRLMKTSGVTLEKLAQRFLKRQD